MIRVYKDKDTKVVTKGAYERFYKPLGYNVVIDEESIKKDNKEPKKQEEKKTTKNIDKKDDIVDDIDEVLSGNRVNTIRKNKKENSNVISNR